MDLDAMSTKHSNKKPTTAAHCYNCNMLGHLARECPRAPQKPQQHRQTPTYRPMAQPVPLHLFEEEQSANAPEESEELVYPVPLLELQCLQLQYPLPKFLKEEDLEG